MKHTINLNEPPQDLMKLKYRLMYASSEEQEHSLFEITKGMKGRGWVSTRFCAYPQEIVIQFYQPVNIKQITLIVHETKIPNAIDFLSFCPIDNRNNSSNNSISGGNLFYTQVPHVNKYKKIGFIKLSTNTKSNYRARECRKVFVDTRATFFKLQFHRNYINRFNLFNQIGLFCLEFYGSNINYAQIVNIPSSELSDEQQQEDNNESNNNNNNNDDVLCNEDECVTDNDLHQICQDKLKVLKEGIQKALTIEDYGECKLLKEIVDKIRQIGKRIFYLEKEKAKMVEYEDYEGAKYAKDEIDKLKAQLKLMDNNNNNKKQRSIITTTSDIGSNIHEEIKNDLIIEQNDKQTINNEHNKYSNININDKSTMLNTNPCDNKRDSNCSILSGNNNSNGDISSILVDNPFQNKKNRTDTRASHLKFLNVSKSQKTLLQEDLISYDEIILPTIVKKLNPNQSTIIPQETGLADKGELEELPKKIYHNYELLLPYIGEDGLRKVFSKQILWKEEGFEILLHKIENIFNEQTSIDSVNDYIIKLMKLVIIFLDEKHPSIIIKTLDIFEKLLVCIKEHSKKLNMEYDFNITDRILDKIKEKLGDVSSKVRMKAVNLYFFMLQQDFCDYNNLITELLEEEIRKYDITDNLTINSSINKRHRATTKLTLGKLQIFNKVLDDVQNAFNKKQTSLETFPYNTLSEYLIIYVDHNRSEIRKLTRLCIGKFIKKFGFDKIKKKLEKVKVRELNKLIMELPQYESQIKDIINGSDSTIVTNRNILNSLNTSNVNINSLNVTNVSNIFSANRTNFSNIGKVKVTVGTRSHKKGFKSSSMAMLPVKKHKLKLKPIAAISKRVKINK